LSEAKSHPIIGIVVVSYQSGSRLKAFLDSIPAATKASPRVIIADNGSTDGAPQEAASASALSPALVIDKTNPGYGAAANAGARALGGDIEWILICNPDLVFEVGSIDELVKAAAARSDVGSAGPSIVSANGSRYPSARELPSLRTGVGHALFVRIWPENPWTRRYLQRDRLRSLAVDGPSTTGWLSGACLLVRKSAWDALGGFDEDFFMYFEDVDLGRRLGEAGYTNLFVPRSRVMHEGAASTSQYPERMLRAHHESAMIYLAKKYPQRMLGPVRAVLSIGLALRLRQALAENRRKEPRERQP
jgi:N-acetylglucosaminyl-diphospho-decaprenol L-rhamnosyltransferase